MFGAGEGLARLFVDLFRPADVAQGDICLEVAERPRESLQLPDKGGKIGGGDGGRIRRRTSGGNTDIDGAVIAGGALGNVPAASVVDGGEDKRVVDMLLQPGKIFGVDYEIGPRL